MESFLLAVASNSMVGVVMAAALLLFGRRLRRPRVLHLLWLAVLIKLVLPPLFSFGVLSSVAVAPAEVVTSSSPSPVFAVPIAIEEQRTVQDLLLLALLLLWSLGTLGFIALCGIKIRSLDRRLGSAESASNELQARVEELATILGVTRIPRISMTEARVSPLVWSSLGSPRLILPTRLFATLTPGQRDTILAHELAHLARGDDHVRWLELAVLAVHWWNPLAWIASRQLREAEESCCDAMVSRALPDLVSDYARGLAETVRHLAQPTPRLVPASGLGRGDSLERRISMLFTSDSIRSTGPWTRVLATVSVLVTLGVSPSLTALELPEVAPQVSPPEFVGDPITFVLRGADLREVLKTLADIGGLEMVVGPEVSGQVDVQMADVPWDQALYSVLQTNGLTYEIEEGVVHVMSGGNLPPLQETPTSEDEPDGETVSNLDPVELAPPRLLQRVAVDIGREVWRGEVGDAALLSCEVDFVGTVTCRPAVPTC